MMKSRSVIVGATLLSMMLISTVALAQLNRGGHSGGLSGAGKQSSARIQDQADNAVDKFSGIQVQVIRVVRLPSPEGAFRALLRVVESESEGRSVTLIAPQATMVDDMTNVYTATSSSGLPICIYNRQWYGDGSWCYSRNAFVSLIPTQPLTVSMQFEPKADSGFMQDLAAQAETATLQARFSVYSPNTKKVEFADVSINGIKLPK